MPSTEGSPGPVILPSTPAPHVRGAASLSPPRALEQTTSWPVAAPITRASSNILEVSMVDNYGTRVIAYVKISQT